MLELYSFKGVAQVLDMSPQLLMYHLQNNLKEITPSFVLNGKRKTPLFSEEGVEKIREGLKKIRAERKIKRVAHKRKQKYMPFAERFFQGSQ